MGVDLSALKKEEERKREAAYDPVKRWIHIQQTIAWAEANLPPDLRRNRPRIPKRFREIPSRTSSRGNSSDRGR